MTDITLDELKKLANSYGYKLVRNPATMLPCICGSSHRKLMHTHYGVYYKCKNCGFMSNICDDFKKARESWNLSLKDINFL